MVNDEYIFLKKLNCLEIIENLKIINKLLNENCNNIFFEFYKIFILFFINLIYFIF